MRAAIVAARAGASTNQEVSARAGITPQTLRNWIRRGDAHESPYAMFLAQYMKAMHDYASTVHGRLDKAGQAGDVRANTYLLDRADKRMAEHDPVQDSYRDMDESEFFDLMAKHPEVLKRVKALDSGDED